MPCFVCENQSPFDVNNHMKSFVRGSWPFVSLFIFMQLTMCRFSPSLSHVERRLPRTEVVRKVTIATCKVNESDVILHKNSAILRLLLRQVLTARNLPSLRSTPIENAYIATGLMIKC